MTYHYTIYNSSIMDKVTALERDHLPYQQLKPHITTTLDVVMAMVLAAALILQQ